VQRSYIALLALGTLAMGWAQPATAADLSMPAPPPAAPVYMPPPFTWTGLYAGGNLGWGWSSGDGTLWITGLGPVPVSGSGDGFLGGVQLGYNWQTGAFVFGAETDFQGSAGRGNLNGLGVTGTLKTPWFGTVRGRIGYAQDDWLFYVTGGGVYGEADYDGTLATTGAFSSSTSYWSWTIGGGIEAMLWDRWSAKLEYLYVGTPSDFPSPPGTIGVDGNINTNIVRAGLNYHF
jgi:outer membrane immunogenic protein